MVRWIRGTATALGVALAAVSLSNAATWEIDPTHSSASFSVRHLMISTVRGGFSNVTGTVEIDDQDDSKVKLVASIDATTIDTREAKRDEHLRGADFLDVAKYPTLTFKSKKAEKVAPGKYRITGDLTLRGVSKEVVLDVDGPTPAIKDPWGNVKAGASATTKIDRQEFGVKWNAALEAGGLVVGNEVSITLDVELLQRQAEPPAAKP